VEDFYSDLNLIRRRYEEVVQAPLPVMTNAPEDKQHARCTTSNVGWNFPRGLPEPRASDFRNPSEPSRYFDARPGDFHADPNLLRCRYQNLANAPALEEM
jgi:hypothetical protein